MKNDICKEIKFILEKNKFIYFTSNIIIRKLCILYDKVKKQIYKQFHDINNYYKFYQIYVRITTVIYIKKLVKRL